MFTHAVTAILVISLGQAPPGSSEATTQPSAKKATTQKAEEKTEKQGKKDPKKSKREAQASNTAVRAMSMVIEDAEFKDMTFEDFVEWLGRTTKTNVVVRWKVLEKEGIERDRPINLKEKNIRVRKLLAMVFDQLTVDLRSVELAAKADGNTLMISTKKELNTQLVTRVYDVQDLLVSLPKITASEMEAWAGTRYTDRVKQGGGRGGGGGISIRGGSGFEKNDGNEDDPADQLVRAITTHIQPLSWKVNGGKGTITVHKGRLIIRNNIEVHQELGGYLAPPEAAKEPAAKE